MSIQDKLASFCYITDQKLLIHFFSLSFLNGTISVFFFLSVVQKMKKKKKGAKLYINVMI